MIQKKRVSRSLGTFFPTLIFTKLFLGGYKRNGTATNIDPYRPVSLKGEHVASTFMVSRDQRRQAGWNGHSRPHSLALSVIIASFL